MERLDAIILAGGSGSRFGGGKLLAPYLGGALIDGAVRAAMAAPVVRVILATGYDGDNVARAVTDMAALHYPDRSLEVVHAERFRDGMAATLRAAATALGTEVRGVFVFLGDMPRVPLAIAGQLAERIGDRSAAAPAFKGERGHPVLFAASLFPSLLRLDGDQGARRILDALGDDLALVPVEDPGVLFDVDRRADLAS